MAIEKKPKKTWKDFVMPFGKYKGRTINQIRLVDLNYCSWAAEEIDSGSLRELFLCALEHQGDVDPGPMSALKRYNIRNGFDTVDEVEDVASRMRRKYGSYGTR